MKKRILLYGHSIFIAGLASSLMRHFDVFVLQSGSLKSTPAISPDIILVDLCEMKNSMALTELCATHFPIVGVNPAEGKILLLSSQIQDAHSVADILEFLQTFTSGVHPTKEASKDS